MLRTPEASPASSGGISRRPAADGAENVMPTPMPASTLGHQRVEYVVAALTRDRRKQPTPRSANPAAIGHRAPMRSTRGPTISDARNTAMPYGNRATLARSADQSSS